MNLDNLRQHLEDYHEYRYLGTPGTGETFMRTIHRTVQRLAESNENLRIIPHEYLEQDRIYDDLGAA